MGLRLESVAPTMLLCLPNEVLEEILLSPPLAVSDLCRVRRVCQLLRSIVDRLWTRVAMTRLVSSHVKKFHGVMERWKGWGSLSGSTHQEWYSLCRERFLCEQELLVALECLSRRCYKVCTLTHHAFMLHKCSIDERGA